MLTFPVLLRTVAIPALTSTEIGLPVLPEIDRDLESEMVIVAIPLTSSD